MPVVKPGPIVKPFSFWRPDLAIVAAHESCHLNG
jgi:hypothetical protein